VLFVDVMILSVRFTDSESLDVYKSGELLSYQTSGSSGFDLRAVKIANTSSKNGLGLPHTLEPLHRIIVDVGISVAIDSGYEMQVRSRSGLAAKNGIFVLNSPGTIDSDYRGHLAVILLNMGNAPFLISRGDRIAQAVICPIVKVGFEFVELLPDTVRGSGGLGSTGM